MILASYGCQLHMTSAYSSQVENTCRCIERWDTGRHASLVTDAGPDALLVRRGERRANSAKVSPTALTSINSDHYRKPRFSNSIFYFNRLMEVRLETQARLRREKFELDSKERKEILRASNPVVVESARNNIDAPGKRIMSSGIASLLGAAADIEQQHGSAASPVSRFEDMRQQQTDSKQNKAARDAVFDAQLQTVTFEPH